MKILRLLGKGTYVEGISTDYNGNWEEIVTTHNAFKAKDFTNYSNENEDITNIASWIREKENTLLEIVEVV